MQPSVLPRNPLLLALLEKLALGAATTPGLVTTALMGPVVASGAAVVTVPATFKPIVVDVISPKVEDGTNSTPLALAPTWKTDPLPTS